MPTPDDSPRDRARLGEAAPPPPPTPIDTTRPEPGTFQTRSPAEFRYPRTERAIRATLRTILEEAGPPGPGLAGERDAALRRLKAYRYVAGLPYANVVLVDRLNDLSTAAADICHRLGGLTHNPTNPGLPEEEFRKAHLGASHSNLSFRTPDATLVRAVAGWMDDSDDANIDRVGHRRWCLHPSLGTIGLGRVDGFSAMYVTETMEPPNEDFTCVAFPPPGYVPVDFFDVRQAWSLSLNPREFRKPVQDNVEVRIFPVKGLEPDRARPITLDYFTVNTTFFVDTPSCVIFRPGTLEVAPGVRYWVEVKGLERVSGDPAPLNYLVEFAARE
jgi:hypothetical protein